MGDSYGRTYSRRGRRSRSRPGTYIAMDNQVVDAPSGQILFNDFELDTMGRTCLKRRQMFSEVTANSLINKHMRRRKSTGYVNFLIDRMRFRRTCCTRCCRREYLNYREIKEMYTFPSRPNAFMLGVQEEKTGKRFYETYVCKNAGDMARVQQLIEQSTSDPQYLLRTNNLNNNMNNINQTIYPPTAEPVIMPAPVRSTVYAVPTPLSRTTSPMGSPTLTRTVRINEYTPRTSHYATSPIIIEEMVTTTNTEYVQPISPPIVRQYRQPQMQTAPRTPERVVPVREYTPVYETPQPILRNKPVPMSYSTEQITDIYRNSRVVSVPGTPRSRARSLSFDRQEINSWKPDDVTFLDPNSNNGLEVVERGSVYLYVSRSKHDDTFSSDTMQFVSIQNGSYWD